MDVEAARVTRSDRTGGEATAPAGPRSRSRRDQNVRVVGHPAALGPWAGVTMGDGWSPAAQTAGALAP